MGWLPHCPEQRGPGARRGRTREGGGCRQGCARAPRALPLCVAATPGGDTCADGRGTFTHTVTRKHERDLETCEHYVTAPPTLSS